MKLKQINLIIATFLLVFSAAASFVTLGAGGGTVAAYTCQGTPDDYYQTAPGTSGARVNMGSGQQKYIKDNNTFRFDPKTGRCMVDIPSTDGMYKSEYADGSARPCNGTDVQAKINGHYQCLPVKTYSTNDKPVHDDGTPIQKSEIFCGGNQDNYDEESFSCKESGSCNVGGVCDYNQVGLKPDPTTTKASCTSRKANWIPDGSDPNKGTCEETATSCKAQNQTFNAESKTCDEPNECDVKYPDAGQKAQRDACKQALDNPDTDCGKFSDPAVRAACQAGQEASYQNCGEAQTVLIKCDSKARGASVIGTVLKFAIQALTVLVGIGAVGGIAWEAIQYARAQDNESIVANARGRIRDIVIGLVVYGFMIAIIQWLVPGGVF